MLIFLATKMLVLPLGDALPEMDTSHQYNHLHYGPLCDSQLTFKQLSSGLQFKYYPEPMILNSIAELNFRHYLKHKYWHKNSLIAIYCPLTKLILAGCRSQQHTQLRFFLSGKFFSVHAET